MPHIRLWSREPQQVAPPSPFARLQRTACDIGKLFMRMFFAAQINRKLNTSNMLSLDLGDAMCLSNVQNDYDPYLQHPKSVIA